MDSKQSLYKGAVLVFVFCSFLVTPHYSQADHNTTLSFSGYVQMGTGDLDAGIWSAPTVYDWDGDGKKDLLVGQKNSADGMGYTRFYKNTGTDDTPSFAGYADIQACNNTCLLNVPGTEG